ncbi:hypothetical protein LIER_28675 [Lithospermum erythrorhizon]|uniref:Uncharacterized protein n=1 Tax=Lithospermum erythrorhizon TaxID=34254 RepID=A0AAV3RI64_LITER
MTLFIKIHVLAYETRSLLQNTFSSNSSSSTGLVTSIASSSSSLIASGYADGSIRIWDIENGTCETTLNGHKSAVSALRYNKLGSLIASGSKDTDIILWDVVGQAGLFRLRGHRDQVTDLVFLDSGKNCQIWSIDADLEERYLVAGSADPELWFYTIKHDSADVHSNISNNQADVNKKDTSKGSKWDVLKFFGEIQWQTKHRVATVKFNKSGNLLACQVVGKMVQMFSVLDENESKRKAKRRINRRKEKKASKMDAQTTANGSIKTATEEDGKIFEITVSDVFKILHSTSYSATKLSAIELQGNHSVVRSVSLSSDNTLLLSTNHNAIKIWNPSTCSCLRTVDSDFGLCSLFVPGNKYAIVSTKSGKLELVDVRSDHDVKFWEFGSVKKSSQVSANLAFC